MQYALIHYQKNKRQITRSYIWLKLYIKAHKVCLLQFLHPSLCSHAVMDYVNTVSSLLHILIIIIF